MMKFFFTYTLYFSFFLSIILFTVPSVYSKSSGILEHPDINAGKINGKGALAKNCVQPSGFHTESKNKVFENTLYTFVTLGTGTVFGYVRYSDSRPVQNATVTCHYQSGLEPIETETDSHGFYMLQVMASFNVVIEVTAPGYEKCRIEKVIVRALQNTFTNITIDKNGCSQSLNKSEFDIKIRDPF